MASLRLQTAYSSGRLVNHCPIDHPDRARDLTLASSRLRV